MARLLIIDDDPLVAQVASEILINAGHACGAVESAGEAFQLMRWRRPDLILLDQDMPETTGTQFLRKLRLSPEFYDLPVIMFTGITGEQDELAALYAGAQDYLRKPFRPPVLRMKVDQMLKRRAGRPGHRDLRELMTGDSTDRHRAQQGYARI